VQAKAFAQSIVSPRRSFFETDLQLRKTAEQKATTSAAERAGGFGAPVGPNLHLAGELDQSDPSGKALRLALIAPLACD